MLRVLAPVGLALLAVACSVDDATSGKPDATVEPTITGPTPITAPFSQDPTLEGPPTGYGLTVELAGIGNSNVVSEPVVARYAYSSSNEALRARMGRRPS